MFDRLGPDWAATDPTTGQRRGLKSAFAKVRAARKRRRDKRSDAIGGELAA
jgi:linoleoyl-CoA desaturase